MSNTVITTCPIVPQKPKLKDMPDGTIFHYDHGTSVYMKVRRAYTDGREGYAIHLESGIAYELKEGRGVIAIKGPVTITPSEKDCQ